MNAQLGIGSHKTIAYSLDNAAFVALPPRAAGALQVSAGMAHACAALGAGPLPTDGTPAADISIVCWGANAAGQLLRGDTRFVGDDALEMGGALVAAALHPRKLAGDYAAVSKGQLAEVLLAPYVTAGKVRASRREAAAPPRRRATARAAPRAPAPAQRAPLAACR